MAVVVDGHSSGGSDKWWWWWRVAVTAVGTGEMVLTVTMGGDGGGNGSGGGGDNRDHIYRPCGAEGYSVYLPITAEVNVGVRMCQALRKGNEGNEGRKEGRQ
jgi:hypothetical protein